MKHCDVHYHPEWGSEENDSTQEMDHLIQLNTVKKGWETAQSSKRRIKQETPTKKRKKKRHTEGTKTLRNQEGKIRMREHQFLLIWVHNNLWYHMISRATVWGWKQETTTPFIACLNVLRCNVADSFALVHYLDEGGTRRRAHSRTYREEIFHQGGPRNPENVGSHCQNEGDVDSFFEKLVVTWA